MPPAAPSATRRYGVVAKALHWAIALLILAQFVIAWTMPDVHKGTLPVGELAWHVVVGVLIMLLVAVRIVWRIVRPPVTTGVERNSATQPRRASPMPATAAPTRTASSATRPG